MENEKNCLYNSYRKSIAEMAKVKRCREMVAKDNLSDSERNNLKHEMERCLKSIGRVA